MKTKLCLYFFIIILFSFGSCNNTPQTEEDLAEEITQIPRPRVLISTQYGDMTIELYNETPLHRDNFLKLAQEGFYDSLLIHRVQSYFMIQGGDPNSRGEVAPDIYLGTDTSQRRIAAEISNKFIMRQGALVSYHRGVGGNPDKSSHFSQFMIIHGQVLKGYQIQKISIKNKIDYSPEQIRLYELYGGSPQLDGDYTIFGQVIDGVHVLNKIVKVPTLRSVNPKFPDRPLEDIRLVVKVLEAK